MSIFSNINFFRDYEPPFDYKDFLWAGILGFVVGDAAGLPFDGMRREELANLQNKIPELIGYKQHFQPPGTWSDNSALLFATMQSLYDYNLVLNPDALMQNYCSWKESCKFTAAGKHLNPPASVLDSCELYGQGKAATLCGMNHNHIDDCGNFSRVFPLAFLPVSEDKMYSAAVMISGLTDAKDQQVLLACLYLAVARRLIHYNYTPGLCYDAEPRHTFYEIKKESNLMSRVQASPMWKNNMSDVQASMLPPYLKDRRLYDGTMFLNDPDACSPAQAAAAATTGLCNQGKLTCAFAAALCRAEMVEKDSKLGAYSYQAAANTTLAEWINNGIYMDDPRANVGEVICVAFDGKNYFSVAGGMGKVDVSKIGMAPFWFALWGMFRSKLQEFDATFKAYCETQEIDETTRQKLACKMAGTAFDATMGDEINCIAPSTTTCRALKEEQTRSAKYTPDEVWGEFQKLDISGSSSTKVPTFKKTAKFVGAFADKNRVLTDEEKSLVPQLGEDYILPKEVVTTCHLIARTRGTARPMTNVMLRGDPSVGKTAGARAIAAGLGLPYTFITCNAGTEMYNLIGDMMPVDSSASADSINEELFKDLPSATDISMDPAAAYEAITGSEKPDATEVECMTELFRKQMKLCADACNNGFKYVESPLVRAIRNGWVCELQEPSLITRPAVMPGLNGLLDETGCVVLPTGEMLHRHPDCIIISTLNIDLEGCRPLNQAFMDRHHIIMDMQCPTDDVIVKRIKGMTGCGDDVPLKEMVQCIHQIATVCARHGATDGNVNSMRSLANWVQAGMLIGDYVKAAEWTVVSGATSDPETRTELSRTVANYSF